MAYASLQLVDNGCTGTAASRSCVLAQCLAACDSIVFGGWRVSICMLVNWTWIVSIEHPWMPSSFCRQPVRHVSRIYIFCVIRQYVWQIVCDFSMLWWRQFRFSELGTGQPINMICKPWIVRFKNYFVRWFVLLLLLVRHVCGKKFYIFGTKTRNNKKTA